MIKKLLGLFTFFTFFVPFPFFTFSATYTFYYGNGCPHCAKVERYFDQNDIVNKYNVVFKEVYDNKANALEMVDLMDAIGVPPSDQGVPFLLITSGENKSFLVGDTPIIDHFKNLIGTANLSDPNNQNTTGNIQSNTNGNTVIDKQGKVKRSFIGIMLPAAISDSINPCAFTVMFLLLLSILTKTKSHKKAILSGVVFSLAIFASYFGMGIGLFGALGNATSSFWLKLIAGSLGILVGLANLKDYFRYGKGFVMEVPFARRPTMKKVIDKVSSPLGAFFVGILVSLFLLPCSSGPYLTIISYLSAERISMPVGLQLLAIYNLIFIIPMVVITLLVGFGVKKVEELAKIKNQNTKLIHLIVGLLMLGLGLYSFLSI